MAESSYRRILTTSSVIGAASAGSILISIARAKVLALLLGPVGVGFIGIYSTILTTAGSVAGLGFRYSSVREIASQRDAGHALALAELRTVLRYVAPVMGVAGMLAVWALAAPLSRWIFGNEDHVTAIAVLAPGVVFTVLTGAAQGLLSGYRDIVGQAAVNFLGALLGTAVGLALVVWLGEAGIPVYVLFMSMPPLLIAWRFTARIEAGGERPSWRGVAAAVGRLARLGVVAMSTSFMASAAILAVRGVVTQELGELPNGYFQAAYGLSILAVGLLLTSMDADYYPRVSEKVREPETATRLVNEQAEVCFFLSAPIILALLTAAPLLVPLLYSEAFTPAVPALRWFLVGMLFKVAAWSISVLLLALGAGRIIFACEASWNLLYVLVVSLLVDRLGLEITGIGFALSQAFYLATQLLAVRGLLGFRLSPANWGLTVGTVALCCGVIALSALSPGLGAAAGAAATIGSGVVAVRVLSQRTGIANLPKRAIEKLYALLSPRGGNGR